MKTKTVLIMVAVILVPIGTIAAITTAAGSVLTQDRAEERLVPSQTFTYQGELMDGDSPEPGPCDFQFGLWDALELGSQLGVTQTLSSVPLINGRFTVELNDSHQFTINPFDGTPRFLAIAVACPSGGGYVPLSPRQSLTPAPSAHFAGKAGSVPWTGILNVPPGFADSIDNDTLYDAGTGLELISTTFQLVDSYQLPQTCDLGQVVEWAGSSWGCVTPDSGGGNYQNVVVVAKSGGAFDSIQGALDSIADASTDNRYLVWVAPGIYTETVDMKSYVDIEGAGQHLTKVTSPGFGSLDDATVEAGEHSQLRFLTVENTGGNAQAIAVNSEVDDFSMMGVSVIAFGGTTSNRGVRFFGGGIANRVDDTTININVDGSTLLNYGIQFHAALGLIELVLDDVSVTMTGVGNSNSHGLFQGVNTGRSGTITGTNLLISVKNAGSTPSSSSYAVNASGEGAVMNLTNSSLYAGANILGYGFSVYGGGSYSLRNMLLEGSTAGIYASSTSVTTTVRVDSSIIRGADYSISSTASDIFVGASLLDGPYNLISEGEIVCVASYDENYDNVNGFAACP